MRKIKIHKWIRIGLALSTTSLVSNGYAHSGVHGAQTLMTAFTHPWLGLDHLLTMLAVGVLAAQYQQRAQQLALPMLFLLGLLISSVLAMFIGGGTLSLMELSLALSVMLCGMALLKPSPLQFNAGLVLILGMLHGWAHGIELLPSAGYVSVSIIVGMLLGSAVLHGFGYLFGLGLALRRNIEKLTGLGLIAVGLLLSLNV